MKKYPITTLLLLFTLFGLHAQDWQTNLEEAQALAKEQNRTILLVFQGSDWCAPCIKLDREIWRTPAFQNYATNHYILVQADFPRKKQNKLSKEQQQYNNSLAEKYNQQGIFPLVVLMDASGKVLGKAGYEHTSPEDYIKLLNSLAI